ncbi:NlpC/P60 family protein [Kordiimonas sp. SCSIO 12610]|uniref:C40 family peptidase n=1 Tax=Kordiimonas sp. SCSIO 12610 TaxID=2829597 RepID=UPI00210D7D39|nr:NlpC/P60 family protein [Kordiimonas sp. SCSIO 12610]UTW55335.1 C40 family peptidase [Kordiimonas sp. SCSIO 12610]
MKKEPNCSSTTVSELLYGESVSILAEEKGWFQVACAHDGYMGWIKSAAVCERSADYKTSHYVSTPVSHIYREPSLKSEPIHSVFLTTPLMVVGEIQDGFVPLSNGGWIYARHILAERELSVDPVDVAERFLGSAYLWGGRSYEGLDCSALVQLALMMSGQKVLRDSGMQFSSLGRLLETDEKPGRGDLAFFPGHVGWMIDGKQILHANATHMSVTIDPVEDVIEWVSKDIKGTPFLGYRRLNI